MSGVVAPDAVDPADRKQSAEEIKNLIVWQLANTWLMMHKEEVLRAIGGPEAVASALKQALTEKFLRSIS